MKLTPIKMRRLNINLSTKEAWEALDISKSTFYKLEQGVHSPGRKLIQRMSKLYKCTTDEIFKDLELMKGGL